MRDDGADAAGNGWDVYVARCADGSLYTGIARDAVLRIGAHNAGRGAKYARGRTPLALVYRERAASRASAQRREHEIKQLSRDAKRMLISTADAVIAC